MRRVGTSRYRVHIFIATRLSFRSLKAESAPALMVH